MADYWWVGLIAWSVIGIIKLLWKYSEYKKTKTSRKYEVYMEYGNFLWAIVLGPFT